MPLSLQTSAPQPAPPHPAPAVIAGGESLACLSPWSLPVVVAALGYFVDIYDIVIFGVVRHVSLSDLGFSVTKEVDAAIFSWQMWGMLVGGLIWGLLGDRVGRLQALWGSIIVYSTANLACAGLGCYSWTGIDIQTQYSGLRFIAGVGLAGELGVAITLVSELVVARRRAIATTVVAAVGVSGAIMAVGVSKLADWRTAYVVGGMMGFSILFLRVKVLESGLFAHSKAINATRGDLGLLLRSRSRLRRLLGCVLIGMPTWFVVGVLIFFIDKLALSKTVAVKVDPSFAIMWTYIGLIAGDLGSGLLSQWWQSRRRTVVVALLATAAVIAALVLLPLSTTGYYVAATCAGVTVGYWAVFVALAAEQFGTNLRATVATVVPSVARGMFPMWAAATTALSLWLGYSGALLAIGAAVIVMGLIGAAVLRESWGSELDWQEEA